MKLLFTTLAVIALILPFSAFSQTWTIHTLRDNIVGAWTRSGDFDQDNDPDILVQSGDSIYWYENLQPGWEAHLIDPHFYNSTLAFIDVVDIDSDGDPDVLKTPVTVPGNDTITWNENQANGTIWTSHFLHKTTAWVSWPQSAYGDLDGDNDLDLVIPEYEFDSIPSKGSLYWLENNNNSSWTHHLLAAENHFFSSIGDMDGDGDLDVVGSKNGIFWLENQLPATTWAFHQVISAGPFDNSIGFCTDLNSDNLVDVVSASNASGSGVSYYVNASWSEININPNGQILYLGPAGDIDNDGDIDITYGGSGYAEQALGWAESQNNGTDWLAHDITPSDLTQRIPTGLGDIDGDGDTDIISLTFDLNTGFGSAIWAENPQISTSISISGDMPLEFDISPNPATAHNAVLSIQATAQEVFWVHVFDLMGKQCAAYMAIAGSPLLLDLGQLPQGTYLVRVSNQTTVGVKRLVKG